MGRSMCFSAPRTPFWFSTGRGVFCARGDRECFALPHGCRFDPQGNLWLTDVGLHQVFKYTPDGKLLHDVGNAEHAWKRRRALQSARRCGVRAGWRHLYCGRVQQRPRGSSGRGRAGSKARGDGAEPVRGSSGWYTRLPWTSRGACTWWIAPISAFRCLRARANFWRSGGMRAARSACSSRPTRRLFVADGIGDTVSVYALDGKRLARWGGTGSASGKMRRAHLLCVDDQGAVYVAEVNGRRVQKFVPVPASASTSHYAPQPSPARPSAKP